MIYLLYGSKYIMLKIFSSSIGNLPVVMNLEASDELILFHFAKNFDAGRSHKGGFYYYHICIVYGFLYTFLSD